VDCSLGLEGVEDIAQFLPSSNIVRLDLRQNSIDADGAKVLATALSSMHSMRRSNHIEYLDLGHNAVGDAGSFVCEVVLDIAQS